MRIAFLSTEYPSELSDAGGLATYIHRMARLLQDFGHEPEVFVISNSEPVMISHEAITVHRVNWLPPSGLSRLGFRASRRLIPSFTFNASLRLALQSHALAKALERRHASAPFDLVQSADFLATGFFVRHRADRVHAVRCSSAADLYNEFDGNRSGFEIIRGHLERATMRRADVSYAPSRYLADHFRRVHNLEVRVIRPPIQLDVPLAAEPPFTLPGRFFIHFGLLTERKGTALLAEALPLAWRAVPELTMVWSGRCSDHKLAGWQSLWGGRAGQVQMTGPLPRPQLYAVLQRADAAVLPSQVDNLPNTVIESLSLGIPVLGTRGASIDELVEEGVTGHLAALGDAHSLADALIAMWLRKSPVAKGFRWSPPSEMKPDHAVAKFVGLCQLREH